MMKINPFAKSVSISSLIISKPSLANTTTLFSSSTGSINKSSRKVTADATQEKQLISTSGDTLPVKFKPNKTFNRLDARFQLQEHHDDNHIFEEEYELIEEVRTELKKTRTLEEAKEIDQLSDKFVLMFLFARRHDLENTVKLLENYLQKRKEYGFDENPPSLEWPELQKFISNGTAMHQHRSVDQYDRMLYYLWLCRNETRIPLRTLLAFSFWETNFLIETESLRHLRNGIVWIIDLKGFGWKNLDTSSDSRQWFQSMSGVFPYRIRGIYVVNGGILLRGVMEIGKLILPKKMMKRVTVLKKPEDLKDVVPSNWLLTDYGGENKYSVENAIADVQEADKKHRSQTASVIADR